MFLQRAQRNIGPRRRPQLRLLKLQTVTIAAVGFEKYFAERVLRVRAVELLDLSQHHPPIDGLPILEPKRFIKSPVAGSRKIRAEDDGPPLAEFFQLRGRTFGVRPANYVRARRR